MSEHGSSKLENGAKPRSGSSLVHAVVGFLAAGYVLVGRWTPARWLGEEESHLILEPRFWLVVGLLILALSPVRYSRKATAAASRPLALGPGAGLTLALLVYMLSSALWAPAGEGSLIKAYELALMIAATLSLHRILQVMSASAIVAKFWQWIIALTILLALSAIPVISSGGRLAVLAGGPNVFGRLMALLYIAALGRLIGSKHPLSWSAALVGSAILVLLSGSRGAMIALIAANVFFFLAYRGEFRRILVIGVVCACAALLIFLYTPAGVLITEIAQARVGELMVDQVYTSGRDVIYGQALKLAQRHPLMGVGLDGFHSITGYVYAHNFFLELLCEGGLVALGLFVAAIAAYGRAIWRHRQRLDKTSLVALVMMLVASQFSGDLYDSRALFLLPLFVLCVDREASLLRRLGRGTASRSRAITLSANTHLRGGRGYFGTVVPVDPET